MFHGLLHGKGEQVSFLEKKIFKREHLFRAAEKGEYAC